MRILVLLSYFWFLKNNLPLGSGHRVVAELASRHMLPSALKEADRLLGGRV